MMKVFKTFYGFARPVFLIAAVLCGILSLFKPKPGSPARTVCLIIFAASVVLVAAGTLLDKRLKKTSFAYRLYSPAAVRTLDPQNFLPLLVLTLITVFPFYLLLVTSIKSPQEANQFVFTWWPKDGATFAAYKELFDYEDITGVSMLRAVVNSIWYALLPTVVGVFSSAISAYAFSKLKFKGKGAMYSALIATIMMPSCVTTSTSYLMFAWYGWLDTPLPLIVPGLFGGASTVMFLREFMMGIPDALLEAARIDGAGKWKSFFLVILPLSRPALMAQFILQFITGFNNYMGPLVYLNDPSKYTIQVAIDFLNSAMPNLALLAAAGTLALLPMLLLYVIFQGKILSGIMMSSGLKG